MIEELKKRLREPTTWAGITAAISGASLLPYPWSIAFVVVGIMGVLVPQPGGEQGN